MVIDQCNAYRHGGVPLYPGPEIFLSAKGLLGTSNFVLGWKAYLALQCSSSDLPRAVFQPKQENAEKEAIVDFL
jgi:hypothetical protein